MIPFDSMPSPTVVLVTGAAGFIGSHFVEHLLAGDRRGVHRILALDNFCRNEGDDDWERKRRNVNRFVEDSRVTLVEQDFCDRDAVAALLKQHQVQRIMHLGAHAGVRASVRHRQQYMQNNALGTLAVLDAARQCAIEQFVLVSSATVYGTGAKLPFCEARPLGLPASPYGESKQAAEKIGLACALEHQLPVVIVRPFSVYGPRLRPNLALSIFMERIANHQPLTVYGDGSHCRDMTHVRDVCDGLLAALTLPQAVGHCINLGNGHPVSMREVIVGLEQAMGKVARIRYQPALREDLLATCADLGLARQILDYQPRVAFADGLRELVDWFRKHRQTV